MKKLFIDYKKRVLNTKKMHVLKYYYLIEKDNSQYGILSMAALTSVKCTIGIYIYLRINIS
jgi:hypothetical protein